MALVFITRNDEVEVRKKFPEVVGAIFLEKLSLQELLERDDTSRGT